MQERSLKFYHQTLTVEIENEVFNTEITIETQEIIDTLSSYFFEQACKQTFKDGEEEYNFAEDFVTAQFRKYQDKTDLADQLIFELIKEHKQDIVSHFANLLTHERFAGHQYFDCGFSELHGFDEDKVCDKCRPYLSRSVVKA